MPKQHDPFRHGFNERFVSISLIRRRRCSAADTAAAAADSHTAYMNTGAFPCVLTTPGRYYEAILTRTASVRRRTVYSES